MTRPPLPNNWEELMAGYALGDLSPEEAEEFKRLLESTPDLAMEVDRLQEVLALMPYALPEEEPPPHLRSKILEAAQAGVEVIPPKRSSRNRIGLPISWLGVAGSVAALLLAALMLDGYRLRNELRETQQKVSQLQQELAETQTIVAVLKQSDNRLYPLGGTGDTATASGSAVVSPDAQSIVVAVQNLPTLPQGKAYRLWAIASGVSSPIYCGQFNAGSDGTASTKLNIPQQVTNSKIAQLLITAESATAPPYPEGPLVMQSIL